MKTELDVDYPFLTAFETEARRARDGSSDPLKSEVTRALDEIAEARARARAVVDLTLCESQRLVLRPDVTYRFTAVKACEACQTVLAGGSL